VKVSSHLRHALPGERVIAQAWPKDKAQVNRIAYIRDAELVEEHPVENGLINYVLEKTT